MLLESVIRCRFFFFFQAEDGIRDLVRSRGLGDVYKRQLLVDREGTIRQVIAGSVLSRPNVLQEAVEQLLSAVSYTHLTLPTSDLV